MYKFLDEFLDPLARDFLLVGKHLLEQTQVQLLELLQLVRQSGHYLHCIVILFMLSLLLP
jgi:hypothetical protein